MGEPTTFVVKLTEEMLKRFSSTGLLSSMNTISLSMPVGNPGSSVSASSRAFTIIMALVPLMPEGAGIEVMKVHFSLDSLTTQRKFARPKKSLIGEL